MYRQYGLFVALLSLLLSPTSTQATGGSKSSTKSAANGSAVDGLASSHPRVDSALSSPINPTQLVQIKKEIGSKMHKQQQRPSLDFHVTKVARDQDNKPFINSGPIQHYHSYIQQSTPAKHPSRLFDIRPADDHPENAAAVERFLSEAKERGKIGDEEHAALSHIVTEKAKAVQHINGGGVVQSATGAVVYLPSLNQAHALYIARKGSMGKLKVVGSKDKYPRIQYEAAPEGWHEINKHIVATAKKLPPPLHQRPITISDSPPHSPLPANAVSDARPQPSPRLGSSQQQSPSPRPMEALHDGKDKGSAHSMEHSAPPKTNSKTVTASPPRRSTPSTPVTRSDDSSPTPTSTIAHLPPNRASLAALPYHVTKAELKQGRVYLRQGSLVNYHQELAKKLSQTHPIRLYNLHPAEHHPDNAAHFRNRLVQKKQSNEISQEEYDLHAQNAAEQLKATMHIDGGGILHSLDDELIHLPDMDRHHVHELHQKEQTARLGLLKSIEGETVRRLKFTLPGNKKRKERPVDDSSMQASDHEGADINPPRISKTSATLRINNDDTREPPSFTSKVTRYLPESMPHQASIQQPVYTSGIANSHTHPQLLTEPLRSALRQTPSAQQRGRGAANVANRSTVQFAPVIKESDAKRGRLQGTGSRSLGGRYRGRGRGGRSDGQSSTQGQSNTSTVVPPPTPDPLNTQRP